MPPTLVDLRRALRASWGPDTCAPEDIAQWSPGNPARGQCATTALVVNDHLGGNLVRGEVHVGGQRVDYHWWNALPSGEQIDLTREQFDTSELVLGGTIIDRPAARGRQHAQYEVLRQRVTRRLGRSACR
ncbi:YunG family protein [Tsukamurella strandjordii]|uniref:YunG family protein n=1 Tax=Tsukamurella strandjordii TaxID=147577 RepID=UPI003F704E6D